MINIGMSLNDKYFKYGYVMLTSLFENNQQNSIRIFVLNCDLQDNHIREYKELAHKYGGEVFDIKVDKGVFVVGLPVNDAWTIEAYFRLLLLDVLPDDVDRLLYLDIDVLVCKPIKNLYEMDFCGNLLAGVFDKMAYIKKQKVDSTFADIFDKGYRYFNSGVLLWNIKEMKREYSFSNYMEAVQRIRIDYVEQDILNYCHYNSVLYLNEEYNFWPWYDYEKNINPTIIHYTRSKPWSAEVYQTKYACKWWEYAKKTPYYVELMESVANELDIKHRKNEVDKNYIKLLLDEKIRKHVLDYIESRKSVALYGGGYICDVLCAFASERGIPINCIIDTYTQNLERTIPIVNIKNYKYDNDTQVIIMATRSYDEIERELIQMNINGYIRFDDLLPNDYERINADVSFYRFLEV